MRARHEESTLATSSSAGARSGAQQQREHQEDHRRYRGDETAGCATWCPGVDQDRALGPDHHVLPTRRGRRRSRTVGGRRGLAGRSAGRRPAPRRRRPSAGALLLSLTAVGGTSGNAPRWRRRSLVVADRSRAPRRAGPRGLDAHRAGRVGSKGGVQDVLGIDGVDLREEQSVCGTGSSSRASDRGRDGQQQAVTHTARERRPTSRRPGPDPRASAALRAEPRLVGREGLAAQQHQRRGQQGQRGEHRTGDADRPDGPSLQAREVLE